MFSSYITLRIDKNSEWDVIHNTFPKKSGNLITTSVETVPCGHYEDEKTAQIAAEKMAELKQLQFVPSDKSVITIFSQFDYYVVMELSYNGDIQGHGTSLVDFNSAISKAKEVASENGFSFITPKKF